MSNQTGEHAVRKRHLLFWDVVTIVTGAAAVIVHFAVPGSTISSLVGLIITAVLLLLFGKSAWCVGAGRFNCQSTLIAVKLAITSTHCCTIIYYDEPFRGISFRGI
jgi:hypothetical protein